MECLPPFATPLTRVVRRNGPGPETVIFYDFFLSNFRKNTTKNSNTPENTP